MLIQFGGGITDIRGSVHTYTFSRNSYGAYARNRTIPTDPMSAAQLSCRAALSFRGPRWNTIATAAQRAGWSAYATTVITQNRLGQDIHLSGYDHYCRSMVLRSMYVLGGNLTPPRIPGLPEVDPSLSAIVSVAGGASISFSTALPWRSETAAFLLVWASMPRSPGRTYIGGPYRHLVSIAGSSTSPPTSPITGLTYPFALVALQKVELYGRISRADKRLSAPFHIQSVVIA
jgi:hypothetical protein